MRKRCRLILLSLILVALQFPSSCPAESWEVKIQTPNGYMVIEEGAVVAAGVCVGALVLYYGFKSERGGDRLFTDYKITMPISGRAVYLPLFYFKF